MNHKVYEHINGLWHQKTVMYYINHGFANDDIEWCVTEKVHGCNFGIYLDQDEVKVAKRNAFIEKDESFYQYNRTMNKNSYKFEQLWDDIVSILDISLEYLIVYGELFGGYYPHKDVENFNRVRNIQKGVYYHPDVNIYAFDIWIKPENGDGYFLDYDKSVSLFIKNDIFHASILQRGTFNECREYPNEFQTKIPIELGLPELEDNICEGIVLKPIKYLYDMNKNRIILKDKNARFKEVSREGKPKWSKSSKEVISEDVKSAVLSVSLYINENRLRNVLSKFGEFEKKHFNPIYEMFKSDVLVDFMKDNRWYEVLSEMEWKILLKNMGRLCVEIWRPIFLKESL